ncbi:MAG: hypothetical protein ACK5LC_05135 [Coprobacillaceae bacterium]
MHNTLSFVGKIEQMHKKCLKNNQIAVDLVIKIQQNPNIDIYDLVDLSVYGIQAEALLNECRVKDWISVDTNYRSSKQLINNQLKTGKFSHFKVKNWKKIISVEREKTHSRNLNVNDKE